MNDPHYIVVQETHEKTVPYDPGFREGDVVDVARVRQWEPVGLLFLPVHAPHLPQRGAVGSVASTAYQRRDFGAGGVPFEDARFTRGCPLPVCMPSDLARVEWMAKIEFSQPEASGNLRLVGEETAHGFLRVVEETLGPRSEPDVLRGAAVVAGTARCFGAVCLAGACVGVRVLWIAATVLPR